MLLFPVREGLLQLGRRWFTPRNERAIGSIAAKIGCTAETLRGWVRHPERDQGLRAGPMRVPVDRDHRFRSIVIIQSSGS